MDIRTILALTLFLGAFALLALAAVRTGKTPRIMTRKDVYRAFVPIGLAVMAMGIAALIIPGMHMVFAATLFGFATVMVIILLIMTVKKVDAAARAAEARPTTEG